MKESQHLKERQPRQEGRFYPSGKEEMIRQILAIEQADRFPVEAMDEARILGSILPHAGHMYSGYQTIPFFQKLRSSPELPSTFIILHPNHSGRGEPLVIDEADYWLNSMGRVAADRSFAESLDLPFSDTGRIREHSAEVILPFMQYYLSDLDFSIVPLCMRDQSHKSAREVAERIFKSSRNLEREVILIASCDFSHFLPPEEGKRRDQLLIDQIMKRQSSMVEQVVISNHLSVCGYGPVMVLMEYAELMDPSYKVRVLARGHSGEVIPSPEVVDYVSMLFYSES